MTHQERDRGAATAAHVRRDNANAFLFVSSVLLKCLMFVSCRIPL